MVIRASADVPGSDPNGEPKQARPQAVVHISEAVAELGTQVSNYFLNRGRDQQAIAVRCRATLWNLTWNHPSEV